MQLAPAAGTALVGDVDRLLDVRQVRRQRAAVGAAPPCPHLALRRIYGLLVRDAFRLDLLGLLEAQKKLVDRQALGPPSEAMALQLADDLVQPIDLGLALRQQRLQRDGIIREA